MAIDKYQTLSDILKLIDQHDLSEKKFLKTMIEAAISAGEEVGGRGELLGSGPDLIPVASSRFAELISDRRHMRDNVMLAVASLSKESNDMFRSGEINEVIKAQLGRYVNVSNPAGDAIANKNLMKNHRLSPRRELYGLNEAGWTHVRQLLRDANSQKQ